MSNLSTEPRATENDFDSDEEIDDDDNWNEMESQDEPTKCLFCDDVSTSIEKAVEHLHHQHHISLSGLKTKFNLDQYSYIKMINYIKSHKVSAEKLAGLSEVLWNDDKYMKPVEVDSWLMFDIEDLKDEKPEVKTNESGKMACLEQQLKEKDVLIEQLLEQINQMKSSFHKWVDRTETDLGVGTSTEMKNEPVNGVGDITEIEQPTHVAKIPIRDDEPYFMSYANFDIHYDMLSDSVRTNSYREAILKNQDSFKDKLVIDLGCGTAILSMFSSQAGAKKVIAIDQSEIIYHAMDIALRNKISNIEFAKGRLENMTLPLADGEKVDIIVSEWMGYLLLFEGMLDSVIHARDKYLKPGGLLLPNRCTVNLVGLGDEERHKEYVGFWNDVYGFDMGNMQSKVLNEAIVDVCRGEHTISESVILADLNLHEVDYSYPNFDVDFELKILKNGKFTAFVGYFDTFFNLPQSVEFSTGPHSKPTHWKQVVCYVKEPVPVNEGDVVRGRFKCSRGKNDARAISIKINAFNQEFNFNLT